ncbi:hypothetical protein U1Q18_003706 [Sarracenia purpurea var. burkii]
MGFIIVAENPTTPIGSVDNNVFFNGGLGLQRFGAKPHTVLGDLERDPHGGVVSDSIPFRFRLVQRC